MKTDSWSLQKRLSFWFALQSFIGLSSVTLAIYAVTSLNLAMKQDILLEEKQKTIRHLIEETATQDKMASLQHKLNDFFTGQSGLYLRLSTETAQWNFGHTDITDKKLSSHKTLIFDAPLARQENSTVRAELSLDTSPDNQKKTILGWTLLLCTLSGALIISYSGAWLVRRALRPVRLLVHQTTQLRPDKPKERLNGEGQAEELQPLIEQFNAVLERQERAYTRLEGFNADVAHELRTPLATLIGQTELALHNEHKQTALQETLISNLEELYRLSNIVNDMLFLAQADQGNAINKAYTPSLASLFHEVVEYHEASLLEARLKTAIHGEASAYVNQRLLKQALSNLLSNATRHAPPGTIINVHIIHNHPDMLTLSVSNTGCGISPKHLPHLFDRFYRIDAARLRHDGSSHGLGLAIVAAIAHMHGGHTHAHSTHGTTTISFTFTCGSAPENTTTIEAG